MGCDWQLTGKFQILSSETYSKLKKKNRWLFVYKEFRSKSVWPLQEVNTNQVIHDSLLLNIDEYIFLNTSSTWYLKWTGSHLDI